MRRRNLDTFELRNRFGEFGGEWFRYTEANVNPTLAEEIVDRLEELHERGLTLAVVEHDMDFVQDHCPRAIVMVQGSVLVDGPPGEVLEDPRVLDAYLGGGFASEESTDGADDGLEGGTA